LAAQIDFLAPFTRLFKASSAPLATWLDAFNAVVRPMAIAAVRRDETLAERGLSRSATDACRAFVQSLERSDQHMPLAPAAFLSLVRRGLLASDVRSVGEPLSGFQVLGVGEARYLPVSVAILLGAVEGDFPRRLPQDLLLDNYFKTRLGLPGWQAAEAIEDTTFRLLKARLPVLVLSYPERRGNQETVRSRFIERALLDDPTLGVTAWNADRQFTPLGFSGAAPAKRRASGAAGRVPVPVTALTERLSATAMGHFLTCPYRFLLSRLDVEALTFAKEDDNRTEGQWLHAVLEAFFTGSFDGETVAEPFATHLDWHEFPAYAEARLAEITCRLAPSHVQDTPLSLQLTHVAWPAFARHLMQLYAEATPAAMAAGFRELKFGRTPPAEAATVALAGTNHGIDGKIDAVELIPRASGEFTVITDYKRKGVAAGGKVAAGLAPQLPLYAMSLAAARGLPLSQMIIGYWSIIEGAWSGVAAGSAIAAVAKERRLASRKETLEDVCAATTALWAWRRDQVTADGGFGPDPTDCSFCDYSGVCRKDDPELGAGVRGRDALRRRMKGDATESDEDGGGA
jgi:hypothetical protein